MRTPAPENLIVVPKDRRQVDRRKGKGGSEGPPCPKCGHATSRVLESRSDGSDDYRRRRECCAPTCGERFTTYETLKKIA